MLKIEIEMARKKYSMHAFVKELIFSHGFAVLYLYSNSVSTWIRGRGLLRKKQTGADRGRDGAENWQKFADILYR